MEDKPNYYAVIPASVRYDNELRANEKLLYGEITALSSKNGICTASNNYFAKLYEVKPNAISKWIKDLKDKGYINVKYQKKGKEIEARIIEIEGIHKCDYLFTKEGGGYSQKGEENITSNNITSKKEIYKERNESFKKPTLEEVNEYCKERNNGIDAEYFIDFYESKNWMIGKSKMKDWKACVRTWEKNRKKDNKEEVLPEWFNKDLNKREEKKESDLTDEQKDRIKRLLEDSRK